MDQLPLECKYGSIKVTCDNYSTTLMCSVSITCYQCHTTTVNDIQTTMSKNCNCNPNINTHKKCETELTTEAITNSGLSTTNSSNLALIVILGTIVGLLLMILVIVCAVLVRTCWLLNYKGRTVFNAEHQLR